MAASLGVAKESSVDAAMPTVLLQLICTFAREHRTALKAFLSGKDVFAYARLALAS